LAAAAITAVACIGGLAGGRASSRAAFIAWWGTFAAASGACLLAGFAKLAVVLGAASAAAALGAVLCGVMPWVRADGGVAATFAVILGAGAFLGAGYDERGLPTGCWAAIALAPAAAMLVPASTHRPRVAAFLRAALPIAVAFGALAVAAASGATSGTEPGY
jgi:hypothetical protein